MSGDLLKVLVVDDENLVRFGIKNSVNWENLGCQFAAEAANGFAALSIAEKINPDIVITDVVMPKMNGMEFIEKLRKNNTDAEIIILSGYDDFNYAKNAIENNALSYLLKPIKGDELNAAIEKAADRIRKKQKSKNIYDFYTNNLKNNLLHYLLTEDTSYSEEDIKAKYEITLPKNKYLIATIQTDRIGYQNNPQFSGKSITLNDIKAETDISKFYILSYEPDSHNVVLLIFLKNEQNICEASSLLKQIIDIFSTKFSCNLTIGVSGIFRNLSLIKRAYEQSVTALNKKAFLGNNRIIDYTVITADSADTPTLSDDNINNIITHISLFEKEKALKIIDEYFNSLTNAKSPCIKEVINNIIELSVTLIKIFVKNTELMNSVFGRTVKPALELSDFEMANDVKLWISDIITKLSDSPQIRLKKNCSPLVNETIFYIMKNYTDSISLEEIARKNFVSSGHLMRKFKQETGKNFTQYLAEFRMNTAISLLKSGKYKVYEVAGMVGYRDPDYFYKTFKKITGRNPKYYIGEGE